MSIRTHQNSNFLRNFVLFDYLNFTYRQMRPLDSKDQNLLALLRSNARASVAELAKQLGVSRATVQSRMSKLEKDGVIRGYTVSLGDNPDAPAVRAHMNIRVDSVREAGLIAALRGIPQVARVHHSTGRWDLIAEIQTDTLSSFNRVIGKIRLLEGVAATETNLLLDSYD